MEKRYGTKDCRLPGFELFFAPLAVVLNPTELEMVQAAYLMSKFGHLLTPDREGGGRFFDHPKAAAWIYINELGGRDPRAIAGILLHDLSEDSNLLSLYRIALNFGADVALDVRAVTKLKKNKEPIEIYLGRVVSRAPYAVLDKLCDRLHNVRTLDGCSPEKQQKQKVETKDILLPTLIPVLMKGGDIWCDHAVALEEKINQALEKY